MPLTIASAAVGGIAGFMGTKLSRLRAALAGAVAGATALAALAVPGMIHWITGIALPLVGATSGIFATLVFSRLPSTLEASARERPTAAIAWLVIACVALLQLGRLGMFVTDRESDWFVGTRHPFFHKHLCLPAYIYGAELNERGDPNIYASEHYLGLNPNATPQTRYTMSAEDPFQYPPPFLLLPRVATALTNDFQSIYSIWYALQATGFLIVAAWLARWVGGKIGNVSLFLLPALVLAFPTLYSLQYGQFHLTTLVLCVGAMLLFERGRNILGGSLLAFAVIAKMFPAVLVVYLFVRKRWSAVAWTIGACAGLTIIAYFVVGPEPFVAFFDYHLPRLRSGQAFAFDEAWPEFREVVITSNQSAFGIVQKLGALGLPGMTKSLGAVCGVIFSVLVGIVTIVVARRPNGSRADQALVWLALLGLGSLMSHGAWADYVTVPALWLGTFLAANGYSDRPVLLPLGLACAFQFLLIGTMPIFGWFSLPVMAALSLVGALLLIGLYIWILLGKRLRFDP